MDPAELLEPLEGQRDETLRVLQSLTPADLEVVVRGDGRTVLQLLCHLVDREHGANFVISSALAGDVVHLSQEDREEIARSESDPAPDWDLARIRAELAEVRESLRRTFRTMTADDLDLPIRWHEWPARTIRTSIPYMLEHEDSHLDEVRAAVARERRAAI
ncbi:MAG TPA: DinB family protein [Candidatus Dormibacteraeota bacterium]|nr:DinB family protein [Candidatus Dormibacteraeota bacterium]